MSSSSNCTHPFLELWGDEFHCCDCKIHVYEPADRIAKEKAAVQLVIDEDAAAVGNYVDAAEFASIASVRRGVRIDWLVNWTAQHGCWEWPTWMVRRKIVVEETAKHGRCRYVDLPSMKMNSSDHGSSSSSSSKSNPQSIIGESQTFVSHCWGAPFGDLVAAVSQCADQSRYVWIDIFTVRQWPGNLADLAFEGVVQRIPSFLLCCTSLPEMNDIDVYDVVSQNSGNALSKTAQTQIAFFRVWCLVEIQAARFSGATIIMKAGKYNKDIGLENSSMVNSENIFVADAPMLTNMAYIVDVRHASATVKTDEERILKSVQESDGGFDGLNQVVRSTIQGAAVSALYPEVQAAACGDSIAALVSLRDDDHETSAERLDRMNLYLKVCAASGYDAVVKALLEIGAQVNPVVEDEDDDADGENDDVGGEGDCEEKKSLPIDEPVMTTSTTSITSTTVLEKEEKKEEEEAEEEDEEDEEDDDEEDQSNNMSALQFSVHGGHTNITRMLLNAGALMEPLLIHHAAYGGHYEMICLLIEKGANDAGELDQDGETCLASASLLGYTPTLRILLDEASVSPNLTGIDGVSALHLAASAGHIDTMELLLSRGAEVNAVDADGMSSLMYATNACREKALELLLRVGVTLDTQTTDNHGVTALMLAGRNNFVVGVQLLLVAGASIDIKDDFGESAMFWSLESPSIVRMLCKKVREELLVSNGRTKIHIQYLTHPAMINMNATADTSKHILVHAANKMKNQAVQTSLVVILEEAGKAGNDEEDNSENNSDEIESDEDVTLHQMAVGFVLQAFQFGLVKNHRDLLAALVERDFELGAVDTGICAELAQMLTKFEEDEEGNQRKPMLASLKDIQTLVSELEFGDEVASSEGEEEDWEEVEEKKE